MMLLSTCALCAALAFSPTPSPSPSASPLPEIAHVFTSNRTDTVLSNTARSTYVVTHAEIVRNGYRTVAEALQGIPALQISPFGAIGSSVNFTLRGSGSSQVLVLIDGVPAPGGFSNTVELGNLPTTGVERIEVVEGGGSTLYGTGAVGGIINIITQRAAETGVTLRYGTFGDREFDAATPHVQFSRIVAQNGFALADGRIRPDVDYEGSALHANDAFAIGSLDAVVRAGIESDHLGAPGPDDPSLIEPSARENDLNENADAIFSRNGPQAQTTLQLGATQQNILYWCDLAGDPNCAAFGAQASLQREGRLDAGLRTAVRSANGVLLYGIDLSRGTVRVDDGYGDITSNAFSQSAAYAEDHRDLRWGSIYAGLRGERDGGLGGEISPSAGFVALLSPGTSLKGNIATAFRAPNATELYYPYYGNPSLAPERAKVADLTLADANVLGGASIGWFGNRTNDLIVPEAVNGTYEPVNVGHAFIEGLVASIGTKPFRGMTASFNVTDLYRAENIDTGERLPNDPVISSNLRLEYAAQNARSVLDSFGISAQMAGARGTLLPSAPFYDQPAAYTLLDAYARMRIARNVLFSVRGYNLGNERYAAVQGFPMPGRSVMLEVSAR